MVQHILSVAHKYQQIWTFCFRVSTTTYLSLAIRPKVNRHGNQVVNCSVRALIQHDGGQRQQRHQNQPGLDAAVESGAADELERPLVRETGEAEDEIYDLQNGDGFDGAVEVGGEEVPEDLGPEEAFDCSGDLVCEE